MESWNRFGKYFTASESKGSHTKKSNFPGDGSEYSGDIKKMFPLLVEQKVFTIGNEDIDDLQTEIDKQIKEYMESQKK